MQKFDYVIRKAVENPNFSLVNKDITYDDVLTFFSGFTITDICTCKSICIKYITTFLESSKEAIKYQFPEIDITKIKTVIPTEKLDYVKDIRSILLNIKKTNALPAVEELHEPQKIIAVLLDLQRIYPNESIPITIVTALIDRIWSEQEQENACFLGPLMEIRFMQVCQLHKQYSQKM